MGEEKKLPKKKNIFNEEEKKVKVNIYGYSFRCEHKIFSENLKLGPSCHEAATFLQAPSRHIRN